MSSDNSPVSALSTSSSGVQRRDSILSIAGLKTYFHSDKGVVRAVDGVDMDVPRGGTMCLVGESGCGKSITARSILGLVDEPGRIEEGTITWGPSGDEDAVDLAALKPTGEEIRRIRGGQIGMVFQESMSSLSPMYTVGAQLVQAIRLHQAVTGREAKDLAIEQLQRVGIPQPTQRFDAYPFQLSGGMCQRVMIAIALANDPSLLIADEPTTALDVTTQARILDLIGELQAETGMSVLFITHDLGVVAEIADEVTVMYLGRVVERGSVTDIFDTPQHPYTRALLNSIPAMGSESKERLATVRGTVPSPADRPAGCPFHDRCESVMAGLCNVTEPAVHHMGDEHVSACHLQDPELPASFRERAGRSDAADRRRSSDSIESKEAASKAGTATQPPETETSERGPVTSSPRETDYPTGAEQLPTLSVRGASMYFPIKKGMFSRATGHVQAVDSVDLDILPGQTVGLVGESGCGKTTLGRVITRALDPTSGQLLYSPDGRSQVDLAQLSTRELKPYREQVRMIFQDPFSSLNPRKTLFEIISAPLKKIRGRKEKESTTRDRVADMLNEVGLQPDFMHRYPHAFSGGQRQRINIARALITEPRLVIADEAVSALDVSVRAQILNLLADLQAERELTYLFISHDLSVVQHVSDRVAVMYLGQIMEEAETSDLFRTPRHPYTEALMSAVPIPDPHRREVQKHIRLADDLPDPSDPPSGCYFHTRCPHRQPTRCDTEPTRLRELTTDVGHGLVPRTSACHYAEELTLAGASGRQEPEEQ